MKKLLISVIAAFVMTSAMAQLNPMDPIPADEDVKVGKLENGMTYYIRHNEKPKNQADFYIYSDVGAIQEADNQQGLAHFLEHMAFNGTKNMPNKMVTEYLEKIGVKFGVNLNAGTLWDKTTYLIKNVPTVREGIIDSTLLILHDWSHFIALEGDEIDSERGVISEELRTTGGASWRASIDMVKALGKGSKYETRNLIGSLDGLKNFTHESLRDFYKQWYRPDYQAIVIVGDIDVNAVEAKIKKLMADIPAPSADAPVKEAYVVPDNEAPIVSIYTDKEVQGSVAKIFIKRPTLPKQVSNLNIAEIQDIIMIYISTMTNARLQDISMQPDAPFVYAGMSTRNIGVIPTMETTAFMAQAQDGKLAKCIESVYTEMEKIRRFGFTQSEFERAQNDIMRSQERAYVNRNDRTNGEFIQRYLDNYAQNKPMPDAETEWKLDSMLIKMLDVNAINGAAQQLITAENQVITIEAPQKDGLANPTQEEILAIRTKVMNSEIAAHADTTVKEPLIDQSIGLKGSPVKKTKTNAVLGTTEWTLANGVRVIVKPTQLKADEVRMNVYSEGGMSLLTEAEIPAGELMTAINGMSGISKFSAADLRKQLSGKTASVNTNINQYSHGMDGYSSPKDIETMLQLTYLNFTSPRFDEADYNTVKKMVRTQLENVKSNPDYIVQERVMNTTYNNNPRRKMFAIEDLDKMDFNKLGEIYYKLYPSAKGFTFTIVGNVDMTTLKPLVEKYIGSIPTTGNGLKFVNDNALPIKGKSTDSFTTAMQEPKVAVHYLFSGDMPYTIENKLAISFFNQALDSRYLTSIREEKGGTYGVATQASLDSHPKNVYDLHIWFDTNEAMANELSGIIIKEIEDMAANGPTKESIEKIREYMLKSWKASLEQNTGWMSCISNWERYKFDYITNYENAIKAVTIEQIRDVAKKVLADGNMVNVIMRPKATAAPATETK